MSFCTMAMLAAKIAVVPPITPTTASAVGAYSKIGDSRATMKTPAVTIVAAWISAETGVGPSIASGSQVCSGICADFPIAPMNSRMPIRARLSTCQPRKSIVVPATPGALPKTVPKSSAAEHHEDGEDPEGKAEIADPVDDEGLDRSGIGRGSVVPETDQADRTSGRRLPSRRTAARSRWPSPAPAWRR